MKLTDTTSMLAILYLCLLVCIYAIFFLPQAFALNLVIPLGCDYGNNCYISRYFDHHVEDGDAVDYTCGSLSKRGYVSTDFTLEDFTIMDRGVQVVAAEAGIVESVRHNMQDVAIDMAGEEAVRGRECGNGVVIRHNRGYSTQYCHLKKDTVTVEPGDIIEQGYVIADVGVSGKTNYPTMSFTVFRDGFPVDPFTGEDPITENTDVPCGTVDIYPLWDRKTEKRLRYISGDILYNGFTVHPPHADGARRGKFRLSAISKHEQFIVYWADMFGIQPGDTVDIRILSPEGHVLKEHTHDVSVNAPRYFQRLTLRRHHQSTAWPPGIYTGEINVSRQTGRYSDTFIRKKKSLTIK